MKPAQDKPKFIGKYEIAGEIGKGGMGVVYKGIDPYIGRTLAIKIIRFDLASDDSSLKKRKKQFLEEAKLAGNLKHPNIVTIYEVGEDSGLFYVAMEYIEGQSLRALLDSDKKFSLDEIYGWIYQICSAISYAHNEKIIHCDIKPGNIMLDKNNRIVIVDFGIARMPLSNTTQPAHFIGGAPSYMSPEHWEGKNLDARSDIFSLGAVIYELTTKEAAFSGSNINAIIQKILNEEPIAPASINPDLPSALNNIIKKAIAKDPDKRYQSCEELLEDIKASQKEKPPKGGINKIKAAPVFASAMFFLLAFLFLLYYITKSDSKKEVVHQDYVSAGKKSETAKAANADAAAKDKRIQDKASQQILDNSAAKPKIKKETKKDNTKIETLSQRDMQPERLKASAAFNESLNKGKKYYEEKKYEKAVSALEAALAIFPDDDEAKRYLELANAEIKRLKQITEYFNNGVKAYNKENFPLAISNFEELLKINPEHKGARKYLDMAKIKNYESKIKPEKNIPKKEEDEGKARMPTGF